MNINSFHFEIFYTYYIPSLTNFSVMTDTNSHMVDLSSNEVQVRNNSDLTTNTNCKRSNEEVVDATNSGENSSNDIPPETLSDHDIVFVTSSSVSTSSIASNQHGQSAYLHTNDDPFHNSSQVENHICESSEAKNTDNQNRF